MYKRKERRGWYYSFTAPNGQRIRRHAQTDDEQQAKELAAKHYNSLFEVQRLGSKPEHSWQETVVEWLKENPKKQQDYNTLLFLRWLDNHLGHLNISQIDREVLRQVRDAKMAEQVKPRTVNAYLQQIRIVLRAAYDWGWLDRVPKFTLLEEPKRRERWLTSDEKERLFAELPEHLIPIVRFALATGLRMSNITQMKWSQIDLHRQTAWIFADSTKAGRPIGVPLNHEAMDTLRSQMGKHPEFVFIFRGKPIKRANQAAWRKARDRAGLSDFRFHDCRHTWATNHVISGTPIYQLKELGSWSSMEMVQKYAHLNVEHLKEFADNASRFGTNLTPVANQDGQRKNSQYN
ncbi:tyrosine-type recombinase/integrase [Eikenella longinqua]|uniref:tyrosine-type recombinase/integrase n=1 Tax=Eikenella longinqua TaxID=1795827 RepID=UPI003CCBCF2C